MESSTLGGTIRGVARDSVSPAVREGRVSKNLGTRLEVAVRSLTGDVKTLDARGHAPRVIQVGTILELLEPQRGDRVWIAEDEDRAGVVVAWEPR